MTDPTKPSTPSAGARTRRRYEPKPRTFVQRVPVSLWILVPFAIASLAYYGYRAWQRSRTVVTFAMADGGAVPSLEIALFPEQFAFASPSPPPPIATVRHEGGDVLVLSNEGLPESFLLRWQGNGLGTGVTSVVRMRPTSIRLTPPAGIDGRVGEPTGFLAFGLRTLGMRPAADARVLCMGAGEHGVVLAESRTDRDGRFRLEGFASDLPVVSLRVLAAGCALATTSHFVNGPGALVPVVPTQPLRGRVALPPGVEAKGLLVLCKGLPGVQAEVAADGSFELEHVPPTLEPRLLVHGLPAPFTHALVHGSAGQDGVTIEVVKGASVRGLVLDRATREPMAAAMVWHDCGPTGGATATTDAAGFFAFDRVPAGKVLVRAQVESGANPTDRTVLTGEQTLTVVVDAEPKNVVVLVD